MNDLFGDRMKAYEKSESSKLEGPYWATRIDGRSFSKLTKKLKRPFDFDFSRCMINTMKELVKQTKPLMGYTQSDEITLIFDDLSFFDGKVQKLTSVLAGIATARFNYELWAELVDLPEKFPHFDCRVWSLPSIEELANSVLWRVHDCRKNSISMAAQAHFSHKELQGKDSLAKRYLLDQIGESYESLPLFFQNGTYAIRKTVEKEIPDEVYEHLLSINKAPENRKFMRTEITEHVDELTFEKIMSIIG